MFHCLMQDTKKELKFPFGKCLRTSGTLKLDEKRLAQTLWTSILTLNFYDMILPNYWYSNYYRVQDQREI